MLFRSFFDYIKPLPDITDIHDIAREGCTHGSKLSAALLIQHFDNVETFKTIKRTNQADIYQLLFQVYFALSSMVNNYTHYDLHEDNVLCYKPYVGNRYVVMNYHFNDGTVITFPTDHVCKIIDYGRNFFTHTVGDHIESSTNIIDDLCGTPE